MAQIAVPESWFTDYYEAGAYCMQSFADWARERMENGGESPLIHSISKAVQ